MLKKQILLDMDGVIAGYDQFVFQEMLAKGHNLPFEYRYRSLYHIAYNQPDGYEHLISVLKSIMERENYFYDLPVIDGAIEGVDYLLSRGHEVTICSAPSDSNPWCVYDKDRWLLKHFPMLRRSAIFTKFKTRVGGDYLIDDKANIKKGDQVFGSDHAYLEPNWKHILFRTPFNADSKTHDHVMTDWTDFSWLED